MPISVFIITLNEEENIARALASVNFADEVVVVDCGSSDRTLEIISSFGIEAIHNDWPGYAKQKQFAMQKCKHDWVLNIDADEEISEALAAKFKEVLERGEYTSVRCIREEKFIGKNLSKWTKKPNNRRFFRRSKSKFDETKLVHESAKVEGPEIFVKEPLLHYGYESIGILTAKKNKYSSLKADEKYSKKKRYSILKLTLIFPLVFLQELIFRGKIFSGFRGLILSVISAHYAFMKEAKLYELEMNSKKQ